MRHAKYGEGTVLMREGEGEDAKLTVMFNRHGMNVGSLDPQMHVMADEF